MNKRMIIISLSVYLVLVTISLAQIPAEVENGIQSSLSSKYGNVTNVGWIIDVNHKKNEYQYDILPITDPYGSLADCYLFTATVNERGILGVYKNNSLVWDSGPMAYDGSEHRIFGSVDLNNDGNVEILSVWDYGMRNPIQNLWIVSWNGQNGTIINNKSHYWMPLDQESEIYTYDYLTEIIDVDGDGIWEIKGINVEIRDEVKIYSWNGQKYGDYGLTMPDYLPMNLLSAAVTCSVSESQYGLLYNYSVANDTKSKQAVWLIAVDRKFEGIYANSAPPNNKWMERYPENLTQWDVSIDSEHFPFDYINRGEKRINFKVETNAKIIEIGNFYIQGKNGDKTYDNKYLSENSFSGKTICGKDPSSPFDAIVFLDTLINYTNQSYELGWIENEKTFNKLLDKLESAKDLLSKGNNRKTINLLNELSKEVEKENDKKLSSEAYALLYYNAEYLITQIPPENLTIALISPSITITKTKDFTLAVHGTDFTKKSEIYWDGKKKKTKFVSENVLEAKIKGKDIKKEGAYSVRVEEKKIGETEELGFNVYKALPEKLIPVVNCVEELDKNKFRVWFGYENYNDGIVMLNGKENELKPGGKHIDKPIIFLPGIHEKVFSVDYKKKDKLKWELVKEKAEVHKDSPKCE